MPRYKISFFISPTIANLDGPHRPGGGGEAHPGNDEKTLIR